MNRYQRRKRRPAASAGNGLRWQLYLLAVIILLAVLYFRVMR